MTLAGFIPPAEAAAPGATAPGRTKAFIKEVKQARLFDLSSVWDETSPIASVNPTYSMVLNATHASTIDSFDGHLSFTSEVQHFSGQHGAPNIDAIGHIGRDGHLFGGIDAWSCPGFVDTYPLREEEGVYDAKDTPTICS
jgi:hypothetical protein